MSSSNRLNPSAASELERLRPALEQICRRLGVARLWLFGSALSPNWSSSSSDFDFLVEYGPPPKGVDLFEQFFVMKVELETLFNRPVDLVDRSAIRKPEFRRAAEASALELYAA
ncbi:MAG: nucleotidyltransferase domain-containing protein [Armatimonadetes bacterium]|nr:nucleotidyltransferase domain-containing protein [Armatimonadota bacterium]